MPWAEGSTKEENWGNAMQSRQDPQQFSDLSEGTWGPLALLENCASLACRQKASISPGASRGRSHWGPREYPGGVMPKPSLPFLFNFRPLFASSSLLSRASIFPKLAPHPGGRSTACQTAAPLTLRGFAESGVRKDRL